MHEKYKHVTEIKAQTDALLTQLSEGEYRSLDTWANNLAHLKVAFCSFGPYMADASFLAWLKQHDAVMLSEIAMTGRALMALQNFFRVASTLPSSVNLNLFYD
ncbi:hypothetical protein CBW22_13095 [Pantoea sp. VS1]|uniref:hypothetical protein n=1 Tax=Pantoea sp. VS1 TaxID=2003658 RepID=UPI000B50D793|nr:hypothetical protein [Pantoea sp. VS1]OWS75206.1 hypothetical protein CBW22_13095 [Pantoea sp. VS1]